MIYGVRGVLFWWRASQNWLGYPKLPWNWPWSFDPLTSIAFRSLLFLGLGRLWIESSSDSKPLLRAKTSHLMWFVDPNFLLEGKTTKVAFVSHITSNPYVWYVTHTSRFFSWSIRIVKEHSGLLNPKAAICIRGPGGSSHPPFPVNLLEWCTLT